MYTITIYQNIYNPNKYLEIKRYANRHFTYRQYIYWNDPNVTNYIGTSKWRKMSMKGMKECLNDYRPVAIEQFRKVDEFFETIGENNIIHIKENGNVIAIYDGRNSIPVKLNSRYVKDSYFDFNTHKWYLFI